MSQSSENIDLVEALVRDLDKRITAGEFDMAGRKSFGIRSRQVRALIALLVERGILR